MSIDESIVIAARVLGLAVFAVAVLGKLRHRDEFVGVVANYRMLPASLAGAAAWLVIALEASVVLALATGFALAIGALLAVGLLVGFAGAMVVNLLRGRTEIDCGCFQSSLRQPLSSALVVRNALLGAALVPLLGADAGATPTPFALLNGVAAGLVAAILYYAFGELLALRRAGEALRRKPA